MAHVAEWFNLLDVRPSAGRGGRSNLKYLSGSLDATGRGDESVIVVHGQVADIACVVAVFEFSRSGGTMGVESGRRLAESFAHARRLECPLVWVLASGGVRVSEGTTALMQMGRLASAWQRFHQSSLPYIALLTHPTLGGVLASVVMRADILIGEADARVGFVGPKVVESAGEPPIDPAIQSSENLLRLGFIDRVTPRQQLGQALAQALMAVSGRPVTRKRA